MNAIRIERAAFARGYLISLHTGDCFADAIGVGHNADLRKALPEAWRDLARNSGRTLAELKALPRTPPLLRISVSSPAHWAYR